MPTFTRAESAWLLIGSYWIMAAMLVLPTRLPTRSAPILGLLPIVLALVLWVMGPVRSVRSSMSVTWTHQAACALLITWPLAWLALILLAMTFG